MIDKKILSTQAIPSSRRNRIFSQYIIKHKFQFKFSLIVTALGLIGMLCLWLESRLVIQNLIAEQLITNEEIIHQLQLVIVIQGKTIVLLTTIIFGISLLFSHFIAGPIFRIEKTLESMRDGNLSMLVRFRKRDSFSETAEIFNQALSSLRHRLRNQYDSIDLVVTKSKKLAETLRTKGCQDEAQEIEQLIGKVKESTGQIKIS